MRYAGLLMAACLLAGAAGALETGDNAPPVVAKTWLYGEPANPAEPKEGTYYLVEFWATWCGPCERVIPLLNRLQKKYGDKIVIVSVTREDEDTVREFQKTREFNYRNIIDDEGETWESYMEGRDTVPHAFLVNPKGVVVWDGNPLDGGLPGMLDRAVAGTLETYLEEFEEANGELQTAFGAQDMEGALEALNRLLALQPENAQFHMIKVRILGAMSRPEQAATAAVAWRKAMKEAGSAEGLAMLAQLSITDENIPARDPAAAYAAMREALALDPENPQFRAVAGQIFLELGFLDEAEKEFDRAAELDDKAKEFATTWKGYIAKLRALRADPEAALK